MNSTDTNNNLPVEVLARLAADSNAALEARGELTEETAAPVPVVDPLTQAYETTPCGRCGGSGNYSYCQMYGTRCFGCSGKGMVYTKRGNAALEFARKLRTVKAGDVQVGWLLWETGGPFSRAGWFTVQAAGTSESKWLDKETGEFRPYWEFTTAQGSICTFLDAEVQAVPDKARLREVKALALAYQATLTKTGTVRKRGAK